MSEQPVLVIEQEPATELVLTQEVVGYLELDSGKGLPGSPGRDAAGVGSMAFSRMGSMYVSTGQQRFPFAYAFTALSLSVELGTAPTGDDFVLVLVKNGSPWVTATLAPGETSVLVSIDEDLVPGDVLTVDITSVGSTQPGADLTAILWTKAIA